MELSKIQKQKLALEQISEYMGMVSQIADLGRNASRMINKSFQAHQNKEIQDLINICHNIALDNELDYEVNIDSYNYDYTAPTNPHVMPIEHFIHVLQQRYYEDHGYSVSEVYSPFEDAMINNELNNNYWDPNSEVINQNAQPLLNRYLTTSFSPYTRNDNNNMYKLSLKQEEEHFEWQSSGGSLC